MPSIRIIDRRTPSPIRRMPRNVSMTEIVPAPHGCITHRKLCHTYADGTIWCEYCMRALKDHEVIDRRRGRAVQQIAANFKPVKVD